MNIRLFILSYTLVFVLCSYSLALVFNSNFLITADLHLYTLLSTTLFCLITVAGISGLKSTRNRSRAVYLYVIKATIAALGITAIIIALAKDTWGVPLYIPLLHMVIAGAVISVMAGSVYFRRLFSGNRNNMQSSEHENVLVVGTTGLARDYIQWIEDAAAEYITLAGVLDEDMSGMGRTFLTSRVIGQPVDLAYILKNFKKNGTTIERLVIAGRFSELSAEAQGVIAYMESKGALKIDRMGDRVPGYDNRKPVYAATPSGPDMKSDNAAEKLCLLLMDNVGADSWRMGCAIKSNWLQV